MRAGTLVGCAVLLASAPTVAAAAQYTFTFEGRGWGHGVGLSQYGARGAALVSRLAHSHQVFAAQYVALVGAAA